MPQEYNVFRNLTVLENLKIAREFMGDAKARGDAVISDELLELFPELPGKFKARAGNLSGGQRQMLALACALAVRPEVLMLDEPSAGLSPKYMADIFDTVRKVNAKGVSVLMVEQNAIEALRISDTCVVHGQWPRAHHRARGRGARHEGPAQPVSGRCTRRGRGALMLQTAFNGLVTGIIITLPALR